MMMLIEGFSVVDVEYDGDVECSLLVSTLPSRKKYLSPSPAQRPTNMMGWPMI